MKPVVLWRPLAKQDMLDIYLTIGLDSPTAAERIFTAIEGHVNLLGNSPRLGARRREIAKSARMLVEGVYLIFYETYPDTDEGPIDAVEIVRVVHGYRNLNMIF